MTRDQKLNGLSASAQRIATPARKPATVLGAGALLRGADVCRGGGTLGLFALTMLGAMSSRVLAGPEGAQVVRGDVRISRQGDQTLIRAGNNSIINFRSFDIATNESVRFIQPSADSRVLNRITGAAPTRIDGSLTSNGRVYLVNPAGVVFGQGAAVNVGGLFAAAGRMSNQDFLRGIDRVTNLSGRIENNGTISTGAPGQVIVLAGGSVANAGSIVAPQGSVVFAAGDGVVVGQRGSNVYAQVQGAAAQAGGAPAIENTGSVSAPQGRVVMAAGDALGMAIRTSGSVRGADVRIEGRGAGEVVVQGTIDASNQRTRWVGGEQVATGGLVRISGERVGVFAATIDASGTHGGGQVEVGGSMHGAGEARNASATAVNSATAIRADATEQGDGGTVVVWSDGLTRSHAAISADGAGQGSGGTIETSGKQQLDVDGSRISAVGGKVGSGIGSSASARSGTWLLDPRNVQITSSGSTDGTFDAGTPDVYTPTSDTSNVLASDIESRLSTGTSVTITTGSTGTQDGDISVLANISASTGLNTPTLRLQAANNIIVDNATIAASGGLLHVELIANASDANDPNHSAGSIRMVNGASIMSNGGNITLAGGTGQGTLPGVGTSGYADAVRASGAQGTAANPEGVLLSNATLDAGTGRVVIRGAGVQSGSSAAPGVAITNGSSVHADQVQIDGVGGSGTGSHGVAISGLDVASLGASTRTGVTINGEASSAASAGVFVSGATVSTNAGNMIVTGVSTGSGAASHGVSVVSSAVVRSTGTGDLALEGAASGTGASGINADSSSISTAGSDLAITTDTLALASAPVQGTGTGALLIRPRSAGTTMGVGTSQTGTLNLDENELGLLSGFDTITIGRDNAGEIHTSNLDFSGTGADHAFIGGGMTTAGLTLGSGQNLTINSSGAVTQSGAIQAERLLLLGSGAMTLTNTSNNVSVLGGNTTGNVRYTDSNDVQIASIGSTTGYTTSGGLQVVSQGGTINVTNTLTISASGATLQAGEVDFAADAVGPGQLFLAPLNAGDDVRVGNASDAGGGLDVTAADLGHITNVGLLGIGLESGTGTLTVGDATTFDQYTTLRMGGTGGSVRLEAPVTSTGGGLGLFGATNVLGANITAHGGDVIINGPSRLATNLTIDGTDSGAVSGSNIEFRSTLDADLASSERTLTINNGSATSGGAVRLGSTGATEALHSVQVSGGSIALGSVRTTLGQAYTGPAVLDGALRSLSSGTIVFQNDLSLGGDSTIETAGNSGDNVTFRGAVVGGANDLAITTGSADTFLFGNTSGDALSFHDRVVLERSVSVAGTTSVTFEDAIDSFAGEFNALTVNSPLTTFGGAVGAGTGGTLGSLTTDAAGTTTLNSGTVLARDNVRFNDAVVLGADTTVTSTDGAVDFFGSVNSNGSARSLALSGANGVGLRGGAGNTSVLSTITTGSNQPVTLGGTIATNAAQNYSGNVVLAADTVINAPSFTAGGTINSLDTTARDLTLNLGTGSATLTGAVGATNALDTLDINASSLALPSVTTTGSQRYNTPTTLTGNLTSTGAGSILFTNTLLLGAHSTIRTAGASATDDITFTGPVNSTGEARNLTVIAGAGDVLFSEAVGQANASLPIATLNASGAGVGLRSVTTTGSQIYTGATTLNGNLTSTGTGAIAVGGALTLLSDATIATNQGDAVFGGTINSDTTARALTINTANNGTTRFVGAVGNENRLSSLTTNADGTTRLEGGQVRTINDQLYNDNVVLGANTVIEGNDVLFAGTLNSDSVSTPRNLTVNTGAQSTDAGETTFTGLVGSTARLGLLTTNSEGTTRIGPGIFTTRGVNIQDAAAILANTTIDGGSGPLTFRSTIDADSSATDPNVVLLSTLGSDADNPAFRFGGNIGATRRLGGLAVGADRPTTWSGSVVFTDGWDSTGKILAASVASTDAFTVTTGAQGFSVGAGHKITALGSLTLTSTGTTTFGDVNTLNNFVVTADQIHLRSRGNGDVQTPRTGNIFALRQDSGADMVAGGSINFNKVPTFVGSGGAFSYSTGSNIQDAELTGIVFREALSPINVSRFADPRSSTNLLPLDLISSGPSSTQTAPASNMKTPPTGVPALELSRQGLSPDVAQQLAELGVDVRPRTDREVVDGLSGRNFDTDMPASIGPEGLTWQVGERRLDETAARAALSEYHALMFTPGLDESGAPTLVTNAESLRSVLADSWDRYATQVPTPTGDGWRAHLTSIGSTGLEADLAARDTLVRLQRIVMSLEDMGLAPDELKPALTRVFGQVRPGQITQDQFENAVRDRLSISSR